MKQVLVLGAGQSSPYLIHYLLQHAEEDDSFITVGDLDVTLAQKRVRNHPRGEAVYFDVNDSSLRSSLIQRAEVVVNMLAPSFLDLVAWDCVNQGRHMISASYRSRRVRDLGRDAQRKDVLLLCEMGLDPGIDHMSAMSLIQKLKGEGGRITACCSYGSGIPYHDQEHNPLRYVITWNPRNVVMAGEAGAQYMEDGRIKIVPYHHVFDHTWPVQVEGVGTLEAYPNRDSLSYMRSFGLEYVQTMIRGTLRYPGWSETWSAIVRLGLPNENVTIPDLAQRSSRQVVEMFLPLNIEAADSMIEERLARFLRISPTGTIMENLRWLGLFSDQPTGCAGDTAAAMLVDMLRAKLSLPEGDRDMVVLKHQVDVEYDTKDAERVVSTMVVPGEPGGFTAMSKTVGMPAALGVQMILRGELNLRGSHIPTHPSIYKPVLAALAEAGMAFTETREPL